MDTLIISGERTGDLAASPNEDGLIDFLAESASLLWREWPMNMQATTLPPPQGLFSLRGSCPHCREISVFTISPGTNANQFAMHQVGTLMWAIMQCSGCLNFILGCVNRTGNTVWTYHSHFPLGKPDDSVAPEVPANVAADFQEALKCRWLDCFKAALIMCRRSIETSCVDLKAKDGGLVAMIEDLATKGVITTPLKDMAHQVRLQGNIGAHAGDDDTLIGLNGPTVDAVISFAREYFHHVYVMPDKLKKIREAAKKP
jgi:hypothetical protein